jgi:hypothetical protein
VKIGGSVAYGKTRVAIQRVAYLTASLLLPSSTRGRSTTAPSKKTFRIPASAGDDVKSFAASAIAIVESNVVRNLNRRA